MSNNSLDYDMIMRLDLMTELGIIINCRDKVVEWEEAKIAMTSTESPLTRRQLKAALLSTEEPASTTSERDRLVKILDADYQAANLPEVVEQSENLNGSQKASLLKLLKKYEKLFDGTLGDWKIDPVKLELNPDAKPVHSRAFPVPHIRKETFRKELKRMVKLGILRKDSDSQWASPTFIIPKADNTVRSVSDFRKVNACLVRKPYPIPKISGIMQELEGFQFATALDLNMGYYTLRLDPFSQDICTITNPWGSSNINGYPWKLCVLQILFRKNAHLNGRARICTHSPR